MHYPAEYGGGIYVDNGSVTLTNSTVSGNSANSWGGGIFMDNGSVTLTNSTVSGNSAEYGGGIYVDFGSVTLTNSTVSGNFADEDGGGIFMDDGPVMLNNSTIAFNTAAGDTGGGIAVGDDNTHTINNSLIANNTNATAPNIGIYDGTHTFNITNSLIVSTTGMTGIGVPTNGVNGNIVGVDPKLGPLANNGGPTQTHAILPGSPAINAGNNALATGLTTDQRGAPGARIVGGTVDMGAFEFQGAAITPVAPQNQTITKLTNLDVSVRVAEAVFGIVPIQGASVSFTANGATGTFTNGATVLTNAQGIAFNAFNATDALGSFSVLAQLTDATLLTFGAVTPLTFNFTYLDFDLIRRIWHDPLAATPPDRFVLGRACATIPELEQTEQEEPNPEEAMESMAVEFDEKCLPLNQE
ncbi:right-handed parallel beta-helix repeat-containing protein [Spirulina major CS-329]|uniref:right-handed parallel beta-helix repeat-containing protein n=1 Tax=Spirulina TaxID=1154 RepID=UPI0023308CB0|nr:MULTISPECIES: right-handed parallel beta-helix repeat-containing protein [Spirulina]MDB9493351.1 right-handed parallel beta-helix repeat-containing protein [Spirulina subsalsa CS-330]MDB9502520.1 right-handed parallel beta-helix repeat-containing protein [Spirulina major CS-329]